MSFSIFPPCLYKFFSFQQPLSIRHNVVGHSGNNSVPARPNRISYPTNHRIVPQFRNNSEAHHPANHERVSHFSSDRIAPHFPRHTEPLYLMPKYPPTQAQVERVIRSRTFFNFDLERVGSGSFSHVYKVTWTRDRNPVTVFKVGLNSKESSIKFEKESEVYDWINQRGNHENIIEKISFFNQNECPFLELSSRHLACNLDKYFSGFLPAPKDIQKLAKDILSALTFLHEECNIAHVDIKNDNILGCFPGNYVLCDLGSAQRLSNSRCPMGNVHFRHPEIIHNGKAAQRKNDLWALGVVIFSVLTKENFFVVPQERDFTEFNQLTVSSDDCRKILFRLIRKALPEKEQEKLDLVTKKYFSPGVFLDLLQEAKKDSPDVWYEKKEVINFLASESKDFQLTKESAPFPLKGRDLFPTMQRLLSVDGKEKSSEILEDMEKSLIR